MVEVILWQESPKYNTSDCTADCTDYNGSNFLRFDRKHNFQIEQYIRKGLNIKSMKNLYQANCKQKDKRVKHEYQTREKSKECFKLDGGVIS